MKVVWSETAINQIRKYAAIIEEDKSKAGKNWIREFFSIESTISDFPLMGRIVPEYGKTSIREVIHGNHRIIYRILKKQILITTVQS